jgi:hypothetical protein
MRAGSWSAVWLLESPRIEGNRIGNQALWVGAIQSNKLTFHVILEMVDGCILSLKTPKKTQNNAKVQAQDRIIHHGRQAGRQIQGVWQRRIIVIAFTSHIILFPHPKLRF